MRSRTQFLIAFCSALIVTLMAVSHLGRTAPGALSAVHGRVAGLAGPNDCSECHGGLFGSLKEACLECHAPVAAQLAGGHGLHGTLGARAEQCGLCHAEHHGATAPIVHAQSFALAGAGTRDGFDHALVGFVLDGAHLGLDCKTCHAHADAPVLPAGAQRFLGLERDCASCHEDAHQGAMQIECASCHGQTTWDGLASLGHERFLPLLGGHGGLACATCHAADGPHALDLLGRGAARDGPRDCATCHESPHTPGFATGTAELAALPPGQACASCHAAEHESFRDEGLAGLSAELHAVSGFPLDAPHDTVACGACHDPQHAGFQHRFPGRAPEQCSACHADVHQGEFEQGPFAGQECTACHDPLAFEPHAFDAVEHARAALPLEGAHLELDCEACHALPEVAESGPRTFRGAPSACDACHADAHAGFFAPFLADLAPPAHGECAHCHDAASFAGAGEGFDHAGFTGFPVLGAHAEGECTLCHVPREEPDEAQRSFGRVEERFGAFEGCVTCHADPHGGRFEPAFGLPAEVEGHADCARCHVESSWRALPRGFDHGFWTGFTLSGAHAAARCADCHEPYEGPSALGRTAAEAAGAACAACHDDPHGGQFADAFGRTACARCHASEPRDFLAFDHESDARFALGEAHRALACDACHPTTTRNGLAVVHFRPLGTECRDCHGEHAGVELRRAPRKR
ncbi:MAG TPA: hypothetical protein VF530_16785 [Planctomycetota bacterium]